MGDEKVLPLMFLTALLSFLLGYIVYPNLNECPNCICIPPTYNLSCPETKCPDCVCIQEKCDYPSFLKIIKNMAEEHRYDWKEYNCHHYSQELIRRLRDYGYEASYCIGKVAWSNGLHEWVRLTVYVEPITGKIIEPTYYKKTYFPDYCVG